METLIRKKKCACSFTVTLTCLLCGEYPYILSHDKDSFPVKDVIKKWKAVEKAPETFPTWLDDKEFINKTFDFFGVKRPEYFPVAMVQGEFLPLFAPYVNNAIFPLREDGFMGPTLKHGKIYPIEWEL